MKVEVELYKIINIKILNHFLYLLNINTKLKKREFFYKINDEFRYRNDEFRFAMLIDSENKFYIKDNTECSFPEKDEMYIYDGEYTLTKPYIIKTK